MRVEKKQEEKKPEKFVPDQPLNKIIILAVLVIASTALFWMAWHNILANGLDWSLAGRNAVIIITTLLSFCLMFSLMAITEVLVVRKLARLVLVILSAGTIFIFFTPSIWSWIAFLLAALLFLYWRREIRIDLETRSKFIPQKTIGAGLKLAVTLMLLAVSFIYYSYMVTGPDASTRLLDSASASGSEAAIKILSFYYKDKFDPDQSIDDFIISISAAPLDEYGNLKTGIEEVDEAIAQGIDTAKDEAVSEARNDFLAAFGIAAEGEEKMSGIIEKIVRKNTEQYVDPYKDYIPALIALALFFALNIFSLLYRELIKSFSFIVFHILVWVKFIKVKKVMVEAEKVSL